MYAKKLNFVMCIYPSTYIVNTNRVITIATVYKLLTCYYYCLCLMHKFACFIQQAMKDSGHQPGDSLNGNRHWYNLSCNAGQRLCIWLGLLPTTFWTESPFDPLMFKTCLSMAGTFHMLFKFLFSFFQFLKPDTLSKFLLNVRIKFSKYSCTCND